MQVTRLAGGPVEPRPSWLTSRLRGEGGVRRASPCHPGQLAATADTQWSAAAAVAVNNRD